MVELNVIQQVKDLAHTSVIQEHWRREGRPWLHGWVYDMKTGRLKELVLRTAADLPHPVHRFDIPE
jgi:carbonic anhydrase